jgi:hypothetical protein
MCNTKFKKFSHCGHVLKAVEDHYWEICSRGTRCSFAVFSEGYYVVEGRCPKCVRIVDEREEVEKLRKGEEVERGKGEGC